MKQILCTLAILMAISLNAKSQDAKKIAHVAELTIVVTGSNLVMSWKSENEEGVQGNWQVQSSVDGVEFKTIGFVWGNMPGSNEVFKFKKKLTNKAETLKYYRVLAMEDEVSGVASDIVKL